MIEYRFLLRTVPTLFARALLALALAAVVLAQTPTPCFVPAQFSVNVDQYNHTDGTYRRFLLVNDEVNARRVQFEEINVNQPGQQFYQYLFLFKSNVQYVITQASPGKPSSCTKGPIPFPYRPFAIPANATFVTSVAIGSPGTNEGFYANKWALPIGTTGFWSMTVSQNQCIPIFEVFGMSISADTTMQYSDFVYGISQPNVFIPPSICPQ